MELSQSVTQMYRDSNLHYFCPSCFYVMQVKIYFMFLHQNFPTHKFTYSRKNEQPNKKRHYSFFSVILWHNKYKI